VIGTTVPGGPLTVTTSPCRKAETVPAVRACVHDAWFFSTPPASVSVCSTTGALPAYFDR
jgi:hypothetical protein